MRLLYVAVTRAEHAVLVFGARAWISDRDNEWYSWGTRKGGGTGSLAAKERFLFSNIRLVVAIAPEHQGRGLELEDLVQAGMLGLNRAVGKFDWRLGYTRPEGSP